MFQLAILLEANTRALAVVIHTMQGGAGVDFDAVASKCLLKRLRDIGVDRFEDVGAALNDGNPGTKSSAVTGHFEPHRSSTKDNDGLREILEIEQIVTRQTTRFCQARHGGDGDFGTCRDKKCFRAQRGDFAIQVVNSKGLGVEKLGSPTQEIEATGLELTPAVVGELSDEALFPIDDRRGFEARRFARKAELPCPFQNPKAARRFEKRLTGHAAAQDAKPADIRPPFDYDCL